MSRVQDYNAKINHRKSVRDIYKNSGEFFQNITLSSYGIYKYLKTFNGLFRSTYKHFSKFQFLPLDIQKKLQLLKLKKLLIHSYQNVPFYRKSWSSIGFDPYTFKSFDQLELLPIISREDLIMNHSDFIASNADKFRPIYNSTGGTTQVPLQFLIDYRAQIEREVEQYITAENLGYNFRDKTALLKTRIIYKDDSSNPWRYDLFRNYLFLSSFHLRDDYMMEYLLLLKKWETKYIFAYPSAIFSLAKFAISHNFELNIDKILTNSETLYPHYREIIEKAFNCTVIDTYGHNEPGIWNSGQCSSGRIHLPLGLSHFEVVKNGIVQSGNSTGELVETCLNNYSMPLIRYNIKDVCSINNNACNCGLKSPTIDNIIGRIEDILTLPDGRTVGRIFHVWKHLENTHQSQLIQEKVNEIIFKVVPKSKFSSIDEKNIILSLKEQLGDNISIKIKKVNSIESTSERGKFRWAISKVSKSYHD